MLTYFHVENYKCLEKVSFPLTPIHVLIGPNDSGKTSVLEAMRTYMRATGKPICDVGSALALPQNADLIFHGAKDRAGISFMALGDESYSKKASNPPQNIMGYGFTLILPANQGWQIAEERIELREVDPASSRPPAQMPIGRQHPNRTVPSVCWDSGQDAASQMNLPNGMFGLASLYRFDPKVLAIPATYNASRKFRMDPDGFGLATLLDDILGFDPALYLQLRKSFCEFFPQFKTIRLETADGFTQNYAENGIYGRAGSGPGKEILFETQWGRTVRAGQASEGVLLFLAFLALVHLPPPFRPKLVLLEEPERGVYPKKLAELIHALKSWIAANRGEDAPQIVMSTHSPYLISLFEPNEVTYLSRKGGGGVHAYPLRKAPNINERLGGGEFYLGELWYNLTEEELFGDAHT
jgi:hypothetical protein